MRTVRLFLLWTMCCLTITAMSSAAAEMMIIPITPGFSGSDVYGVL